MNVLAGTPEGFDAWVLADRFGPLPPEVETLDIGPAGALLGFWQGRAPDDGAFDRLAQRHDGLKRRLDGRLVLAAGECPPAAFHRAIRRLLRDLAR